MKRRNILFGTAGALMLVMVGWNLLAISQDKQATSKEQGVSKEVVRLGRDHQLGGVTLKPGTYLVIHKELGDKQGVEACTFVYRGTSETEKDLAVKTICRRSTAEAVKQFKIESTRQPDGSLVVHSIQFPASGDVHNFGGEGEALSHSTKP